MSKVLLGRAQPGDTATTVVTAADITRAIDAAWVCNPTAGAVTLDVHLCASGQSPADSNALYKGLSVAAGDTVSLSALVNQCIQRGSFVSMAASAASSLTVTISGRQQ